MRLIDADKLKQHYSWWNNDEKNVFDNIVDLQPTIESRPTGKWIVSKKDSNFNCSICGCNPRKDFRASSLEWIREINGCDMQYCPWCGADMRGEE